jgi:hypothetical protein
MTQQVNPCECELSGWCNRHQVNKSDRMIHHCKTSAGYWKAWEEGYGPGQPARKLGDKVAKIIVNTTAGKVTPCQGCNKRRETLNTLSDKIESLRKKATMVIPVKKVIPRIVQRGPNMAHTSILDISDLANDSILLAGKIAQKWPDADGIAGVPRSGMIAASIIATNLGLPMYECSSGHLERLGGGRRMRQALRQESERIVVIEDSVNTGWSLNQAVGNPINPRVLGKATVYCTPTGIPSCDLFAVELPLPHYFTWHMFGSNLLCKYPTAFDMDGILCHDCSHEADDDGEKYLSFLENVAPLYPYTGGICGAIITARIEKYRSQTEAWLAKHRIRYKRLIMGPWSSKKERSGKDIGEWKGLEAKKLGMQLFIESDGRQAPKICQTANIPVMCPAAKKVFTP